MTLESRKRVMRQCHPFFMLSTLALAVWVSPS